MQQLIAITLVAELGDFSRFSNPKQLMAFLGLVPGEYSSGNSIRPRGITKVGNSELRRLLYEAAWSYRTPAKVGAWLIYYRPDSVPQLPLGLGLRHFAVSMLRRYSRASANVPKRF